MRLNIFLSRPSIEIALVIFHLRRDLAVILWGGVQHFHTPIIQVTFVKLSSCQTQPMQLHIFSGRPLWDSLRQKIVQMECNVVSAWAEYLTAHLKVIYGEKFTTCNQLALENDSKSWKWISSPSIRRWKIPIVGSKIKVVESMWCDLWKLVREVQKANEKRFNSIGLTSFEKKHKNYPKM